MKKLLIIVTLICILTPLQKVYAVGEFSADYDVEYAVSPAGITIVTQRVTLTNKKSNLYPKQYAVIIDTDKIQNVIARDSSGTITPDINQHDGKTDIMLSFNKQIVGVGKQLSFTLRYENLDFARQNGAIWEVNIPGINDDPDLAHYSVTLQVPPTFGPNSYMSPLPSDGLRWNKDQMVKGGISAAYGDKQQFGVNLTYFIQNPKLTPVYTEIALPPDTQYQKVFIDSIEPKPVTVRRDDDGNWLARFDLNPGQKLTVLVKNTVTLSLAPTSSTAETTSLDAYLKPLPYWESNDARIAELAKTYKTPRQIYDYVVSSLTYDYTRVSEKAVRKGAVGVLATPKEAICMEFTDLFIAMSRAAGIPAREQVGYAYTTNTKLRPLSLEGDVLHAWPSYYDTDKKMWIAVDPTWGNTTGGVNYFDKLDFNHIVFAIHGSSSTQPAPAGFYRQDEDTSKNVQVDFVTKTVPQPQALTPQFDFPQKVTAGFGAKGYVRLENSNGQSLDHADIVIRSAPYPFMYQTTLTDIPPFSTVAYPVRFAIPDYLAHTKGQLIATVNGKAYTQDFQVRPFYWLLVPEVLLGLSLILTIVYILKRK
jgi:transglutaminase-like putative cysteine protease